MLNLLSGSIRVFFAKSLHSAIKAHLPRPALIVTPDNSTWNDFGHNFFADLHLITADEDVCFSAFMRLMFQDESYTFARLNQLFAQHGPLIPCDQIKDTFCSILVGDEYYGTLVSKLTLDEAVHGLRQLGDAVVLEADGRPDPRLELIRSKPFHLGALRSGKAYSAWRRAKRHLRHNPPDPVEDAASNFSVKVHLPILTTAYEIDFDFNRQELLRNRIAVLIGQNGVGKTQLLLSMIRAAAKSEAAPLFPGALAEAEFNPAPTFNSLLVFSSVASDPYPETLAPWESGLDYNYFSLISRGDRTAPTEIDPLTASLADIIRSTDGFELPDAPGQQLSRTKILRQALEPHIQYSSIYLPLLPGTLPSLIWSRSFHDVRYASLQDFSGELRTLEAIHQLDWTRPPIIMEDDKPPRRLSSGQLALLRFAVQAIGAVQTGSLLLMDEPETHLHPNFISILVEVLHTILEATRSCAIIATHSAYIVREVPRSRVLVLRTEDGVAEVSQPRLQTFGASIDSISHFVFGDAEIEHLHEILLRNWLDQESSIDAVLEKYGAELNPESLSYIRRVLDKRGQQ
jgi:energy-coupling factor transporter ATP-binding protein EcfA2